MIKSFPHIFEPFPTDLRHFQNILAVSQTLKPIPKYIRHFPHILAICQITAVRLQRLSWPFLPKPQQLTAASCLCCPRNVFTGGYSFHVSVLNTQCTLTLSDNCWSREERMDFLSTLNMPTLVERCITRQRWQVRLCIVAHLRHQ